MAYTAVKLADVQKAIAAVTAAQKKYTDAQASTKTSQTAVTNAQKTLDAAQSKLQSLQSDFDNQTYLSKNSGYQNALKAITTAEKNRDAAQSKLDAATSKNRAALQKALDTANKAVDTAYANKDKAQAAAEKAAYAPITAQQKIVDSQQKIFDTAQNKYQSVLDSIQPYLDQRNDAIGNVSNYINDIKGSLGDVTKAADAQQVKTLLGQIQTAVNGTKLTDLIDPVKSMISEIDPLKMANIPKVSIQGANPDYFNSIDPKTGLPVLDQGALDNVLSKYKGNTLSSGQYRDNYDKFGWNVKSDGSSVAHGAAIVGLDYGNVQQGMHTAQGFKKAGTNTAATDADFKKAADQLGIDINQYYSGKTLDKQALYNDISDRTKDFYVVANALDRTGIGANQAAPHASILFRADGSGNLVPVTKEDGSVAANYYSAVGVTHEGWQGQLAELAPVITMASMAFMPGISSAFSEAIGGSTLGGALGTTAAGEAVTLGSILGTTGTNMLANAALSGGLAAITGGDVLKSAISGAITSGALSNASEIANATIGGNAVKAIASATGMTQDQVAKIVANGLSTGVTASLQGKDALDAMKANVLSNIASVEAKNTVGKILSGVNSFSSNAIAKAADAAGAITKVGSQALVTGQDLGTALTNAAPSIIGGLAKGAPVVEKGIYDQTTAGLSEGQVGAIDYRPTPDESQLKFLRVSQYGDPIYLGPDNEEYKITPEGKVTLYAEGANYAEQPSGADYSGIQGQAGTGALSIFSPASGDTGTSGGLGSIYGSEDGTRSLPEVPVFGTPEGEADDYFAVGTGASGFPLTPQDEKQIQQNLASIGLDPLTISVISKNYAGKSASVLNNLYATLLSQKQKSSQAPIDLGSNIMMTPEQMQARGIPYMQQPEQPQFYKRGGLASIR